MQRGSNADSPPVALVTGANRGIGRAVAAGLADRGFATLVGARDEHGGETTAAELRVSGSVARFLHLDVTDVGSITRAAAAIDADFGRLDVLVNNAAVKLEHHPAPPSTTSLGLVRQTYETNLFGAIAVVQAMLPLLLRSDAPRVVNVSSGLGSLTWATTEGSQYQAHPYLAYGTSKAALNSVTVQFANELRHLPIKVNAADPGPVGTGMTRGIRRTPEEGARVVIALATLADDGPTGSFVDESGPVPW